MTIIKYRLYLVLFILLISMGAWVIVSGNEKPEIPAKKNILFAISDDQSWIHNSYIGCDFVLTPAFDQIASKGAFFSNAYAAAPQCSPNRAAILTGRHIWELEEAGTHGSYFPKKYEVFTRLLENAGYLVGYTHKGWAPGNYEDAGWTRNPVGNAFNKYTTQQKPARGISDTDYAANFVDFMESRKGDQPFFFWYGAGEPHRVYEEGSGVKSGKALKDVNVPDFLPDVEEVRSDLLDYALEIEWFDDHLGQMINYLATIGELENTLIVVTSDNGMPFPRAKANLYEFGVHLPLAIYMPGMKALGEIDQLFSFIDFAPTFLDYAGLEIPSEMKGESLLPVLTGNKKSVRQTVYFGRERHSHSRADNLGYPSRGLRHGDYLYIRNFKPQRFPAGEGPTEKNPEGYYDIDNGLTKLVLLKPEYGDYLNLAVGTRPEEELYNVKEDPNCLYNKVKELPDLNKNLAGMLFERLKKEGDPRTTDGGDIFESYPRFGKMRDYPGFRERGEYNSQYQTFNR